MVQQILTTKAMWGGFKLRPLIVLLNHKKIIIFKQTGEIPSNVQESSLLKKFWVMFCFSRRQTRESRMSHWMFKHWFFKRYLTILLKHKTSIFSWKKNVIFLCCLIDKVFNETFYWCFTESNQFELMYVLYSFKSVQTKTFQVVLIFLLSWPLLLSSQSVV